MKLIPCPINGLRPLNEFVFGGEYRAMPDPLTCTDQQWAAYVHYRDGAPGVKKEWWYHSPSGTWFIAERNTLTDEFIKTYLAGQLTSDQMFSHAVIKPDLKEEASS